MKKAFTLLFIAAITNVFAQYPTDSLLAYFPFNSNILNTTFYGIPSWSTGVTGQTYGNDRNANSNGAIQSPSEFSGDGRISMDDFVKYKMTGAFTIALWVKPQASYSSGTPTPIQLGNSITINFDRFNNTTLRPQGILKQANGTFRVVNNAPTFDISTQPWIHIAFVRSEAGFLTLYVNGVGAANAFTFGSNSYGALSSSNPAFSAGDVLSLGFAPDPNNPATREFGGFIDDVFIYNRALDANELFTIYGLNNSTSVPCSPPAPTFTGSPASLEVCQGIQLGLTADPTIPGASYFWYNQITDVNPAGGGAFFLPNTSTPGARQVYLRQSVPYCTQQSGSTLIEYEVNPAPTINVVDEGGNAVTAPAVDLCTGDSLLYTASGTADSYNYFFSTEQQGFFTQEKFNIIGTINSTGCTASFQQNVNRVSIASNLLSSTQLTAGETSGQQYDWFDCDADSLVATTTSNSYIPSYNGRFYVVITKSGCVEQTSCANFFICGNENLALNGDVDENSISVSATGGEAPYTFSWSGPSGFTAGNVSTLNNLANGTYTATVEDSNGCTATFVGLVDVGTSISESWNTIAGIYPNPVHSVLNIELKEIAAVEIFNLTGVKLAEMNGANQYQFNTSSLASGVYFVKAGQQMLKFVKN